MADNRPEGSAGWLSGVYKAQNKNRPGRAVCSFKGYGLLLLPIDRRLEPRHFNVQLNLIQ